MSDKTKEEIYDNNKKFVAKISGLGGTLVMGHKATYFDSAALMSMNEFADQEVAKARREELLELKFNIEHSEMNKIPFNIYDEICVRIENTRQSGDLY